MVTYAERLKFPDNKKFAFTIVDDTDNATVQNVKPVYDFLKYIGVITTKTVWVYPPRMNNPFKGECLLDEKYLQFIKELQQNGFEIALHGVGSGAFTRHEIIEGIEIFKEKIGYYPKINTNHSYNPDNIYWGRKRAVFTTFRKFYSFFDNKLPRFYGEIENSPFFWGDIYKKYIKYTRNFICSDINTIKCSPDFLYFDPKQQYANFWFASSDGNNVEAFNSLVAPDNIDRLLSENGICIVYTHFAQGFVKNGEVDPTFKENMKYLASKEGWFVPASMILDFLLEEICYNSRQRTTGLQS